MHLELIYGVYFQSEKKAEVLISPSFFRFIEYTNIIYAISPKNKKLVMNYYFFIYKALVF